MKNRKIYFEIHPHVGFSNTDFTMWTNGNEELQLKVLPEEIEIYIPSDGAQVSRKLPHGEHEVILQNQSGNILQKENIFVEDSIKVGGGVIIGKYVLDSWIILVMKDRTWFHNRKTKQEFVEFKMYPNSITEVTPEILCFKDERNYIFYSMQTMEPLLEVAIRSIIHYDKNLVIYEKDKSIVINNYDDSLVIEDVDKYSFCESTYKLYIYHPKSDCVEICNLNSLNNSPIIYKPLHQGVIKGFIYEHYLVLCSDEYIYIENIEIPNEQYNVAYKWLTEYLNVDVNHIYSSLKNIKLSLKKDEIRLSEELSFLMYKDIHQSLLITVIHHKHRYSRRYGYEYIADYVYTYCNTPTQSLILIGKNYKSVFNTIRHIIYEYEEDNDNYIVYDIETSEFKTIKDCTLFRYNDSAFYVKDYIMYSLDGEELFYINGLSEQRYKFKQSGIIKDNSKYYRLENGCFEEIDIKRNPENNIAEGLDTNFYYIDKDGVRTLPFRICPYGNNRDCILYEENNEWSILEWNEKLNRYVHSTIFSQIDKSYFKDVMFCEDSNRLLCRQEDNTICYYNIATNQIEHFQQDTSVVRTFNANKLLVSEDKYRRVVYKDPITLTPISPEYLSQYGFFSADKRYMVNTTDSNNPIIKSKKVINDETKKEEDIRYITVVDSLKNENIEIDISNVRFINYVTFTHDSELMAIAGATGSTGYILVYNLETREKLFEYPRTRNSNIEITNEDFKSGAIWIVSYNKQKELSLYNSDPTTYIFEIQNDSLNYKKITNRNFLCFSPSGRYFAMSIQGYHAYARAVSGGRWGHFESTKVFIGRTDDINKEMGPFEDIGKGQLAKTNKVNVGVVAFSLDEKKLLTISDDGTFVVRNIHLDDENLWNNKEN